MVSFLSFRKRFSADQSGSVLTEGLVVFPIMLAAIVVCIELGMVMTQWNLFTKAAQLGARKLVVSSPMVSQASFDTQFAFDPNNGGGLITPNAADNISCVGTACPNVDWLLNGPDRSVIPDPAWLGIRRVYGGIEPQHVRITYETSGLGYDGRPMGPVVSVKLEIDGDAFQVPVISALMEMAAIDFPSINASATSEDLSCAPTAC